MLHDVFERGREPHGQRRAPLVQRQERRILAEDGRAQRSAPDAHEVRVHEVLREVRDLDGWRVLAEERSELSLPDFVVRFESASGHQLDDLASRSRSERLIRGRIEFSLLAISRYGIRACDIAAVLCKGRNSITRWLNQGLCDERDDPVFGEQIDRLDAEISS